MARVHLAHISRERLLDFDHGLEVGLYAFRRWRPELQGVEVGDLILFGVGGIRRGGGGFAGWQTRELAQAELTRVTRAPFDHDEPLWPDERAEGEIYWNPVVGLDLLEHFSDVPLAAGAALSHDATEKLYLNATGHRLRSVDTAGSPLLEHVLPPDVLPPILVGRRAADQQRPSRRATIRETPLESLRAERSRRRAQPATEVVPAESPLVHAYDRHLRAQGHQLVGLLIDTPSGEQLRADAYFKARDLLVEAKSVVTRDAIRHAIGQLFDYRRYREVAGSAVLLPAQPNDDMLELLALAGIDAIWRRRAGFADTRGGLYC